MKNILLKTSKFISPRLIYLIIGLFIAISITYVYAAWNEAKTNDSGQLSQTNWNSLVNEIHNKCGSNCDTLATNATASDNNLTESNWNNLIDLANNTLVDCTPDNNGKCFINQTSKSALDTDLVAGNIRSGVNIFGVTGTIGPTWRTTGENDECNVVCSSYGGPLDNGSSPLKYICKYNVWVGYQEPGDPRCFNHFAPAWMYQSHCLCAF